MANNCDDAFQELQRIEEENRRLQEELDANNRRMAALGAVPEEQVAQKKASFRTSGGRLLELSDAQVEAMHKQAAARMSSSETGDLVLRSLGEGATPVGADGRFENYRRLLGQLGDLTEAEDWGRITEMLYSTWRDFMPQDHAFVLRPFGQPEVDAMTRLLRDQFPGGEQEAGAAIIKAIQDNAVGFQGLAERKVRIRFMADLAKFNYHDAIKEAADALEAIPGQALPPELRQQMFSFFKVALLAERQDKFANRQLGQALRSQQLDLGQMQRLQIDATEAARTLKLDPRDVGKDSHFARVMEAINDRSDGAGRLRELAKADAIDMIDPANNLDAGWQNPHVRYAIALSKDSQLTSLRPNVISNLGGNGMMNLYGPTRTWLENIGYLAHNGTSWNRAFLDGFSTTWNSHRVAMDMTRAAAKDLMADAFHSGKILFGGNEDFPDHGKTYNDALLAKVQDTFNQPIMPKGPNGENLHQPQILARMIGKLQAGPRLLMFEKTGSQHHWLLTPGFRALGAVDNVFGFHAYVFKTRNDLELRARAGDVSPWELLKDKSQSERLVVDDSGQLVNDSNWVSSTKLPMEEQGPIRPDELYNLSDPTERQAWIDRELADSFYNQAPTEKDVIDYRRTYGLKGSDVSDDEIKLLLSERNAGATYGGPNLSNPSAIEGRKYSDFTRMQHEQEGALGHIDMAMVNARKHWAIDALVPYWRAPFNSFLFDTTLGLPPITRTLELWGKARKIEGGWEALPAREVARVQAGWATSGIILSLFAGLDAAGWIVGNGPSDPLERRDWILTLGSKKPNSIAGVPLGGLPVFNTLFLWKDMKDAAAAGMFSRFDRATFEAFPQVLTSQLVRQTGFAQLKQLFDVLTDPQRNLSNFASFMGTGLAQPFVGLERSLQLVTGSGPRNFYQPKNGRGDQEWRLPPDDPFEQLLTHLNNLAYKLEPGAWATIGKLTNGAGGLIDDRRITEDHLGTPIRYAYGTPLSFLDQFPATPGLHPEGDKKLYGELDAQNKLAPPAALLMRNLDGVAMSPALQKEYVHYFAHAKGDPGIPLSGRMDMGGKSVTVSFPYPVEVYEQGLAIKGGENQKIDLGPFLDKHVAGKTVQQALRSLINDPIYRQMQDNPSLSNDPRVRDMPPSERRRKAASVMIQGVYDYYHLLAVDRIHGSPSPAATDWKEKKAGIVRSIQQDTLQGLKGLPQALGAAAE